MSDRKVRVGVRPRAHSHDQPNDDDRFKMRECMGRGCGSALWLSAADDENPADYYYCRHCAWVALHL